MPLKQHPKDPDKLVYVPREYDLPTKREWVGLTDEEVFEIERYAITRRQASRAIEAKLKEKNT